jgi:catechol 2,3-dioxygenase
MSPSLQLVSIDLRVADLARSVEFYTGQLGLAVLNSGAGRVELGLAAGAVAAGAGNPEVMLTLTEVRPAPPARSDAAGLFHAALLLPTRAALGAWLRFAAERGVKFDGFADHGVSEAIYFADPDGNGLEFYADLPRETWPFAPNGELAMVTRALDVPALLATAAPASAVPLAGAHWGHLHLRVTDLDRSEKFYRDLLGVVLTQGTFPGARFLAADGYHHHLGLNTWGRPRASQSPDALGLAEATFARAGVAAPQSRRDPDGIALKIVAARGDFAGR